MPHEIPQQSLVGLGARGNDPPTYSTISEASLWTLPISVRGDLEKRPRLPRDPVVIEVVEAAERPRR
jgi:hypothetical protein